MKNLLYFGIILILASCGLNELERGSTVNVNGREVSTVKTGPLEVMTEDLGKMDWYEAMKACADLGDGWRLPGKDELNILYNIKDKIGGFASNNYWSHTESFFQNVWVQGFSGGGQVVIGDYSSAYVRAVRLEGESEDETNRANRYQ